MTRAHRTREFLSHFAPWMVVAYIGLAAVTVAGWNLSARIAQDEARTARIAAVREAEDQAAKDATVARCLASREPTRRVSRHVQGVNEFTGIVVQNAAAIIRTTPRSDPQYRVRRANLLRLIRAREKVLAVSSFPVPSVRECRSRGG